jgi:hypothetical protein
VVRNPSVLWRRTLAGVVVLGPDAADADVLPPPGDLIWEALAAPVDIAGLARTLAASHGAPLEVVERDVERYVDQLVARGLAVETQADEPGDG